MMTEAEFEAELQSLQKAMNDALARYHRHAGAVQFAEFLRGKVKFDPPEKPDGNVSSLPKSRHGLKQDAG